MIYRKIILQSFYIKEQNLLLLIFPFGKLNCIETGIIYFIQKFNIFFTFE